MTPRNNPLNIRYSRINHWAGLLGQSKGFCVFKDITFGYRAAIILIRNYIIKKCLLTPNQILNRFAPSFENDLSSYKDYLRRYHDIDVNKPITDFEMLFNLIKGMAFFETHSRVSIDTLRYIASHYGLYLPDSYNFPPRLASNAEPIKGV